jgi:hypothetical protein
MMALGDIYPGSAEMGNNVDTVMDNLKIMITQIKKLIGLKDDNFAPKREVKKVLDTKKK